MEKKTMNVIDAINVLISATNVAYSRNAFSMSETRDIINAIDFLGDAIKTQQAAAQPESVPAVEQNTEPSEK
jgi:hypothetical protein